MVGRERRKVCNNREMSGEGTRILAGSGKETGGKRET